MSLVIQSSILQDFYYRKNRKDHLFPNYYTIECKPKEYPSARYQSISVRNKGNIIQNYLLPQISHRKAIPNKSAEQVEKVPSKMRLKVPLFKNKQELKKQQLIEFLRGEMPHIPFQQIFSRKKFSPQKQINELPAFNILRYQGVQL